MTTATIRPMTAAAANDVLGIYQTGLDGGAASFTDHLVLWEQPERVADDLTDFVRGLSV